MPEKLFLNAEVMRVTRLAVNGTDLAFCVNTRRWSPYDYTVDVTALMHEGENIIELDGISESIVRFTRPQYLFLSGDFTVAEGDRIAAAVETIPAIGWEKAGYPYYCGDGTYRAKVCLDAVCESARLIIPTDDIAAVWVNGKPAGKKLWPNHEIEVSSLLVPGENEITVCITSCRTNMFGCAAEGFGESIFYGSYAHAVTENGLLAPLKLVLR